MLVLVILHDDRHTLPLEVERQFVYFSKLLIHLERVIQVTMAEDRLIHQIFQTGLVVAVHIPVMKHPFAGVVLHVQVLLKDNLAFRDRAGLVRAEHIHGTKILDGIQAFDNYLLFGHRNGAFGQVDRYDHRHHLGGQTNSDRQGEQEGFQPIVFA